MKLPQCDEPNCFMDACIVLGDKVYCVLDYRRNRKPGQ